MSDKLCELVKKGKLKKKPEKYMKAVGRPEYVCMSCGRASEKKENICKSEKIED